MLACAALLALSPVAASSATCGEVKDAYRGGACCGGDADSAVPGLRRTLAAHTDATPLVGQAGCDSEFDFVVGGAGTSSLGTAARLAQAGEKVLVLESGRYLEPATVRVQYQVQQVDCATLGTPAVAPIGAPIPVTRYMGRNWPALVDAYVSSTTATFQPGGRTARRLLLGQQPVVNSLNDMLSGKAAPNYFNFTTLQEAFAADPDAYADIANHPMDNVIMVDSPFSVFTTGVPQAKCWLLQGPAVAAILETWTHASVNQFAPTWGSNDLTYNTARNKGHGGSFAFAYSRGNTVGGSSVANAHVAYGLTHGNLEQIAHLTGDGRWVEDATKELLFETTVSYTPYCDYATLNATLLHGVGRVVPPSAASVDKHGARWGCFGPMSMMAANHEPAPTDGIVNTVMNAPLSKLQAVKDAIIADEDPRYLQASFVDAQRAQSGISTSSYNVFSNRVSSAADYLVNLEAVGVEYCFYPSERGRILHRAIVDVANMNCETNPDARLHIRVGHQVTRVDLDDANRAVALRAVDLTKQPRPPQTRMPGSALRTCDPRGEHANLYGTGLPNTDDCAPHASALEYLLPQDTTLNGNFLPADYNLTDPSDLNAYLYDFASMQFDIAKTRNAPDVSLNDAAIGNLVASANAVGAYLATPQSERPHSSPTSASVRGAPAHSGRALGPLVDERRFCAKKEVVLGLGAPGTTATLLRSGIGPAHQVGGMDVVVKADLPAVGRVLDNYEAFTGAFPKLVRATSPESGQLQGYQKATIAALSNSLLVNLVFNERVETSYVTEGVNAAWTTCGKGDGYAQTCTKTQGNKPNMGLPLWVRDRPCNRTHTVGTLQVPYGKNLHGIGGGFPGSIGPIIYDGAVWGTPQYFMVGHADPNALVAAPPFNQTKIDNAFAGDLDDGVVFLAGAGFVLETCNGGYEGGTFEVEAHPLGKVGWTMDHTKMPRARCECIKEMIDSVVDGLSAAHGFEWEFVQLTKRKLPLTHFASDAYRGNNEFGASVTGTGVMEWGRLADYFDDATNPIVGGYKRDLAPAEMQAFCDDMHTYMGGHHIMGGAPMGKPDEVAEAAIDGAFRVYETKNLRVVDASAARIAPSGNPWMAFTQWGQVAAQRIAEVWGLDQTAMWDNGNPFDAHHPYCPGNN